MKLLYDLTACQPTRSSMRHGGGRYAEVLFQRMVERGISFSCYYDSSRWIHPVIKQTVETYNIKLYNINGQTFNSIVEQSGAVLVYSALPINILECDQLPCRLLYTWHGLRNEETPMDDFFWKYKHSSYREVARFLLKRYLPKVGFRKKYIEHRKAILNSLADFVVVSNHTLCSLMSFYPEAKGRDVKVFYSPSTSSKNEIRQAVYQTPFFLIVSANRWSKNGLRAIMALDRLFSMGYLNGFSVRVTGADKAGVYKYKLQNPERFVFMGYVEDNDLEQLYHDTYSLIYPSLNEGFGYPPIEAMHYGIPVLASAITSIPEVCGDAAIYFNPFSVEEIMARILWITKPSVYQEYKAKARARYSYISRKQEQDLDALIDYMLSLVGER